MTQFITYMERRGYYLYGAARLLLIWSSLWYLRGAVEMVMTRSSMFITYYVSLGATTTLPLSRSHKWIFKMNFILIQLMDSISWI